jgi:AcrR family transcriptional regulator
MAQVFRRIGGGSRKNSTQVSIFSRGRLRRRGGRPIVDAMAEDPSPPTEERDRGWRGSADLWLDAAHAILVESGVGAVKIGALADRLGLSRTSFYWHFADREALLAALLARWRQSSTQALVARIEAPAASVTAAILALFDAWVDPAVFDSRAEFAIRTWALTDPAVAAALAEEDAARIAALTGLFRRFGASEAEADTRARTVYLTQVGYIAMRSDEDFTARMQRIPAYALVFTGIAPTPDEIAAFVARNAVRSDAPAAPAGSAPRPATAATASGG